MSPTSWSALDVSRAGGQAVAQRERSRAPRPKGPTPSGLGRLALLSGAIGDVAPPALATDADFAQLFVIALCFFGALLGMFWWIGRFERVMQRLDDATRLGRRRAELELLDDAAELDGADGAGDVETRR